MYCLVFCNSPHILRAQIGLYLDLKIDILCTQRIPNKVAFRNLENDMYLISTQKINFRIGGKIHKKKYFSWFERIIKTVVLAYLKYQYCCKGWELMFWCVKFKKNVENNCVEPGHTSFFGCVCMYVLEGEGGGVITPINPSPIGSINYVCKYYLLHYEMLLSLFSNPILFFKRRYV